MFQNKKLVSRVVANINKAAVVTMEDLAEGRVAQEPAFTDRLLANIQVLLDGKNIGGVKWRAKTLSDRGKGSEESRYGADFLGSLVLELGEFSVSKGFLAQAKLTEPSQSFAARDFKDLKGQCEKMLNLSSASYVFLYSQQSGIQVVPAIEVASARSCNPHELTGKAITAFFKDHLECFIGDTRIKSASADTLEELKKTYGARAAIQLHGTTEIKPKATKKGD